MDETGQYSALIKLTHADNTHMIHTRTPTHIHRYAHKHRDTLYTHNIDTYSHIHVHIHHIYNIYTHT